MNLFELFKPTKNILREGIDHPEDLIIANGSAGADRVLKDLASLEKNPETVTVKWDGFPAVVFGRDQAGNLVFVDKHMYEKVVAGKMDFATIRDYDEERGANRSSLWEAESVLRPALEKIVPAGKDKFWMGDLMWTGTPPTSNGKFVFKPNTVEYRVGIDGELGERISRSVGGIAVHTYIPGLGQSDQPLIGLKGLPEDGGITFLVGEMKDKPRVLINKDLLAKTQQVINDNRQAVDEFVNQLTAMKGKSVITAMGPFITRMLEENDIQGDIVPRFLDFLKERLTPAAAQKMLGTNNDGWLYTEGSAGLMGIWSMWAAITDLKIHIKQQIDTQQQGSQVQAVTDGLDAHEGYVFGAGKDKLKLIDRLGFSRANFAKHKVPDEEVATKSKMPLAAFCFGRMNPPTKGHELVMQKTVETGGENSFIFLSNSNNPDTDPLDPKTKAAFISEIYPQFAEHIVTDYVQGPIYAANWLYQKGFRNMAFVAGSDRLGKEKGSIEKLLNGWNSGPIRSTDPAGAREHVVIQYVSSGDRDPDAEGVTGYSGSKARAAAAANDEQKFQQFTGVGPDVVVNGKTLYQATREGMGLKDQQPQQAAPVKQPAPTAPSQQVIGKEPKVPGKAPMKTKQADLVESILRDKADYVAKRKALQDIQLNPETAKDPELRNEVIRRKHELEREAKKKGIIAESIMRTLVDLGEDNFGTSIKRPARPGSRPERNVKEGDVLQFPKKHKGDLDDFDECPKCGRDLMGGKYMGHAVKVCNPCKQVYLPPNSGIDKQGNKIDESDKHSFIGKFKRGEELYSKVKSSFKDIGDAQKKGDSEAASRAFKKHEKYANLRAPGTWTKTDEIAGAFPSPSTKAKWAADAAASNAAEAKRLAAKDAERLKTNTELVDKEQKINHHSLDGEAVPPKTTNESPIEMDPQNPNDPMVMPPGLNPGKLSYRKSRAASQLADLARMAAQANEADSPAMWDSIVKHFPELETNIRSIQHGMQELEARRRKGGIASKGINKV